MLFGINVPLRFWPEAAQYAVHILNRRPMVILGSVTPVEKWSKHKPSVEHLRIFGCVAFALIPYVRRIKLDEKSVKCIMFGVSKESKAYRLYDPESKMIIISKDVTFDEEKQGDWEENVENTKDFQVGGEAVEAIGEEREETEENGNNEGGLTIPVDSQNAETHENDPAHNSENDQDAGSSTLQAMAGRNKQRPIWMKD